MILNFALFASLHKDSGFMHIAHDIYTMGHAIHVALGITRNCYWQGFIYLWIWW